jgi:hypothetical protein
MRYVSIMFSSIVVYQYNTGLILMLILILVVILYGPTSWYDSDLITTVSIFMLMLILIPVVIPKGLTSWYDIMIRVRSSIIIFVIIVIIVVIMTIIIIRSLNFYLKQWSHAHAQANSHTQLLLYNIITWYWSSTNAPAIAYSRLD